MTITGSCHCGKSQFRIEGEIPPKLTRCTCTFCSRRGALVAYYAPEQFQAFTAPADDGVYRWNTKKVAHHFCENCGISTYSDSPAFEQDGKWDGVTRRIGVNARLFNDFDANELPVEVIDGRHLW
ncbi:GFA family protein [soil metagenome]